MWRGRAAVAEYRNPQHPDALPSRALTVPAGRALTPQQLEQVVTQALAMPPRRGFLGRAAESIRHLFTGTGFMTPGEPLTTVAPEGTPVRQFEYPISVNRFVTPRGTEQTGFYELRGLTDNAGLIRYAIETCKDEEERFDHDWVPDEESKRKENDGLLNEIAAFMKSPDGLVPFNRWMRELREDQLAIDAPALHIRRTRGGEVYALEVVDGALIKPLVDVTGRVPREGPAYEQIVYGVKAAEFTRDELIYLPRNRRAHHLYGYPVTEQLLVVGNSIVNRGLARLLYYTDGNIPAVFLKAPKEWTAEQMKQAQLNLDAMMADIAYRRRALFVPEAGIEQMHEPPLKTDIDEWDAREVMFAFSLSPMPFIKQGMNRASATIVQETAIDQGLIPRQMFWSDFFRLVLRAGWGVTDIGLNWQEVRDPDPKVQAEIAQIELHNGAKTINEWRTDKGLEEVEGGDEPFILTANGQLTLVRDLTVQATLSPEERAIAAEVAGGRIPPVPVTIGNQAPVAAKPKEGETPGEAPPAKGAAAEKPGRTRGPSAKVPAVPMAAAIHGRPRKTVQTIPKKQRNFWLAEREPPPPRARPSGTWRAS